MNLSPELLRALQEQMNVERYNAAVYDAKAAELAVLNWDGFSNWAKKAADDERTHAQKFADFIIDRFATPEYQPLPAVLPTSGNDPVAFFQVALERENVTTDAINTLYYLAEDAEDPDACVFLHWFIAEQRLSVREVSDILLTLGRLDMNGKQVVDNEMK